MAEVWNTFVIKLAMLQTLLMQELKQAAFEAFIHAHSKVLGISGVMFLVLSVFVWRALPAKKQRKKNVPNMTKIYASITKTKSL